MKDLPMGHDEERGYSFYPSWDTRRSAMWDDTLEVYWAGGWGIRKKSDGDAVEE